MTWTAITFHPIGFVENNFNVPTNGSVIKSSESRITLNSDLVQGLDGLVAGQQVLVLFHFHRSEGFDLLQHPQGDMDRPMRGVFSLRSPRRPNPIGATVVKLVAVDGNVLRVMGLDAINGTPVLDLKPA
ncbi:MAG: tRNA (N6-threonylcarbamoyladenosine(37)-N6)-methyltransferase TrmO [Chloroflexota bacterium]|nr:tRNA (N6-threonylcarbamoyladenosine(37)-N6)-methyltransferase TrmO [Chloroflexota bacterium]